ncbi:MAG: N-acetyl-gamma-glutamyl-phosphate reductase [Candidatus Omnitrophica bacterium]|nr:N-acetyl-gamma-glutamyl-phosphate reductase [Candidatus Omnitrophota bacterium]MCM8810312.1 N-acetyl-gamma-glutamyl-phosphate reductase [Candidatus Omnitrophota bacterium]
MDQKIKVGIFGASGYAGQKLIEILLNHPFVEITDCYVAPEEGNPYIEEINPKFKKRINLKCKNSPDWEYIEKNCDCIFLALPHIISMSFVPEILNRGKIVIDLSADYRFKNLKTYEKWYTKHKTPDLIKKAIYGLPEINREKIKNAKLVANPGCYPTSVILAVLPLIKNNLIKNKIIANSVSGVSGAGKNPSFTNIFVECNENIKAYKIGQHRHQPEIEEVLNEFGDKNYKVLFVPHLAPYNQGILSTIYVELKEKIKQEVIQNLYIEFYKNEPFVRIMDYGISASTKNVFDTNFCDIGIKLINKKDLIITSAIDNLVKGASGQAVQNMNIIFGFKETLPFIF